MTLKLEFCIKYEYIFFRINLITTVVITVIVVRYLYLMKVKQIGTKSNLH